MTKIRFYSVAMTFFALCTVAFSGKTMAQQQFIKFDWNVQAGVENTLLIYAQTGQDFAVNWGDGPTVYDFSGGSGAAPNFTLIFPKHTYSSGGNYTVRIFSTTTDCFFGLGVISGQITELDVSYMPDLQYLGATNGLLRELNLSNSTQLVDLYCQNNQLTALDISACSNLYEVHCFNNRLPLSDLYAISQKISSTSRKYLGTQNLKPQTLDVNGTADFSTQTNFGGTNTVFTVTKDGAVATQGSDYSLSGGIFTFLTEGVFVVKMTNAAITSSSLHPAEVYATFYVGTQRIELTWEATSGTSKTVRVSATNGEKVFVDWGDGTFTDTVGLGETTMVDIHKTYSVTGSYSISVAGGSSACDFFWFIVRNQRATALDVSKAATLTRLYCENNLLTSLDVSANTPLTNLYCLNNQLTVLDVSSNTELGILNCNDNQLTVLNLSANTKLGWLECQNNLLTTLHLNSKVLAQVRCYNNQLTSLDVSTTTNLNTLECYNNLLTSLNLGASTPLDRIYCQGNQLTAIDLTGFNYLTDFKGEDQNVSFTLYNNGSGVYTRTIALNNPTFSEITITYASGELRSFNNTVTTTDFTVKTGNDTLFLSGVMNFTYSDTLPAPPVITTTSLPSGTVGTPYSQTLTATGDTPITWSVVSGNLPNNLTLSPAGIISGVPTADGTFNFTVRAENYLGDDTKALSITIGTTSIAETRAENVKIYPNPTSGELRIATNDLQVSSVHIFDIVGKLVLSSSVSSQSQEIVIDISHLTSGTYFVKLKTATGELTKKIIKE